MFLPYDAKTGSRAVGELAADYVAARGISARSLILPVLRC